MSWSSVFRRANSYAQAKAEASFESHADPKIQLEQAISALQEHHRELEAAASDVIGQEKLAKMHLADLSADEAKYTKLALTAKQQGNLDAARAFATQLANVREQIQSLSAQIPQLEQAADSAREAVQESAEQMQEKLNEKSTILAQVDQARMQQQMAASLAQVTDLTSKSDVPSFDEIKQKVAGQFAQAQAQTELASTAPGVAEMHAHHAELTSQADAILAELDSGTLAPAALGPGAPSASSATTPSS